MTRLQAHEPEFTQLLDALCEDSLTREDAARLGELILSDRQARMRYITYMYVDGARRWDNPTRSVEIDDEPVDIKAFPALDGVSHPPVLGFFGNTVLGGIGLFHSMPFVLLLAAVLVGAGVWIGSLVSGSRSGQIAVPTNVAANSNYVGRVTGLVDCRLADPRATVGYSDVTLGSKYEVASGFMEITYRSGAKVILQGPATYEVDSTDGGYLAVGKLTGRLDKNSNLQSPAPNPFAIRTSAATVTDLGTEFGLAVDAQGRGDLYVFAGKVKLETLGVGPQRTGAAAFIMPQGSAAKVATTGEVTALVESEAKAIAASFARQIVHDDPNIVDLLDVVAGGNGYSWLRERGIVPSNGDAVDSLGTYPYPEKAQFSRVPQRPMIDGVFVPAGEGESPVQLDSAGHMFEGFLKPGGEFVGPVWSHAANYPLLTGGVELVFDVGKNAEYMPRNWGTLVLPNAGITFDLDAIRKAHDGTKTVRFLATAGQSRDGAANLWVFVDGEIRFARKNIKKQDGPIAVDVPLTAANRFLTLASNLATMDNQESWLVLGDPMIKLERVEVAK